MANSMESQERLVRRLIRPEVLALSAYHVQDARGLVKLDAMENPYPWPDGMIDEWLATLRAAALNRYPDPDAPRLRAALASAAGAPDDAMLVLGNGSDELIQIILMAIAGSGRPVLVPEPTFVMYRQIASSLGLPVVGVPLQREDFWLDMPAMREALREHQPAVIFLAYPNNPTGNQFALDHVIEIMDLAPGLVVLDEAYAPFADASFMSYIPRYENLLVMRTLSKWGLAGLRLGFLAGQRAWLEQLEKLRLPYNINVLTQISAEFALSRHTLFDEQVASIRSERARLSAVLGAWESVRVYPSQTNFLTIRLRSADADAVFAGLKTEGILVKNLNSADVSLHGCLRVTVGTEEENQQFVVALRKVLGE